MMVVKKAALLLSCAVLGVAFPALAKNNELTLEPKLLLADASGSVTPVEEPERRALMHILSKNFVGRAVEDAGFAIFGHAEAGYTWNFDKPDSDINIGRLFDFEHDELVFNQLDLTVERAIDATEKKWDLGGRMEWVYGEDAGFMHSNGLFDWYDGPRDPDNQWDLHQLYADLSVPLGNGLLVRAGKFITPLGYELINPTATGHYSHGYLFNWALPFTHTGVLLTYYFDESVSLTAGATRGWDQSEEDNNDAIDGIVQLNWKINDEVALIPGVSFGPQQADNDDDMRYLIDVILTCNPNDTWSFALDGIYATEESAAPDGDDATWYGIAGYLGIKLNDNLTFNARAEWFADPDGVRVLPGIDADYFEVTLGVTFRPLPQDPLGKGLAIRPEIRADHASEDVFNDGEDDMMYTFGVDVVYGF